MSTASELLRFSRELIRADDLPDLIAIVRDEVHALCGYRNAWFYILEDSLRTARLVTISGDLQRATEQDFPILTIEGDPMLEEIVRGEQAVVVADARVDPRTDKRIVEVLGNRTIVNVPLRLLDRPLGILGTGTFGAEGVRPPTPQQLDALTQMASYVAVAVARIHLARERVREARDRLALERRLAEAMRLESLGLLAGGVAHDFNNLLTVVLASAQLLQASALAEPQRERVANIVDAAGRAATLTRQLLAVGRRQQLTLTPIDVTARLRPLVKLLAGVMPPGVAVELVEAPDLPAVEADPAQLDQVITNLCLNARDAMSNGGHLRLDASVIDVGADRASTVVDVPEGRYVVIDVSDDGTGIDPAAIDHIFEPFFTTKELGRGAGLGLSIVRGVVQQHGGAVRCRSKPGAGSTFSIYLPASSRAATATALPPMSTRGNSERILVADDQPEVRGILVQLLRDAGYDVSTAGDGLAALETARALDFDLLVLDVVMPGLSGIEVTARLRELRPEQRVVLTTGYSRLQLGRVAAPVIEKPFDAERLLQVVRQTLDEAPRS